VKQLKKLASKRLEDLVGVLRFIYYTMLALFETPQAFCVAATYMYAFQASSKSSIKLLWSISADCTQSSETKRRDLLNGKHILTCDGVGLDGM
jgi:hypothetical protein